MQPTVSGDQARPRSRFVTWRRRVMRGAVTMFKILPINGLDVAELLSEGSDEAVGSIAT